MEIQNNTRYMLWLVIAGVLCSLLISPFTFDDGIYTRNNGNTDSLFLAVMLEHCTDSLLSNPLAYYEAPFLFPDLASKRLSSTYLTHSLVALPVKLFSSGRPYLLGEVSRFLTVLISFIFTALLLNKFGLSNLASILAASSVLLLTLNAGSIDRIQSLSFGWLILILLLLIKIFNSSKCPWYYYFALGISIFLLIHASIYIAVVLIAIAPVFIPLIYHGITKLSFRVKVLPIIATTVVSGFVLVLSLLPWLLNRWDLGAYGTEEFVKIKHWFATDVHQLIRGLPEFGKSLLTPGIDVNGAFPGAGFILLCSIVAMLFFIGLWRKGGKPKGNTNPREKLAILSLKIRNFFLIASAVLLPSAYLIGKGFFLNTLAFDALLLITIASWIVSLVFRDHGELGSQIQRSYFGSLALLIGLVLIIFSFGNAIYSLDGEVLISHGVFGFCSFIFPPNTQIRFLYRITALGFWFATTGLFMLLSRFLQERTTVERTTVFAVIAVVSILPWFSCDYSVVKFENYPEGYRILEESENSGGLLELPLSKWTDPLANMRMNWQRIHRRPIVDGMNSIAPPWFPLALETFNSFPSLESRVLMSRWGIDTVIAESANYPIKEDIKFQKGELLNKRELAGYLMLDMRGINSVQIKDLFSKSNPIASKTNVQMLHSAKLTEALSDGNTFYESAEIISDIGMTEFELSEGKVLKGVQIDYGFAIGVNIPSRIYLEAFEEG